MNLLPCKQVSDDTSRFASESVIILINEQKTSLRVIKNKVILSKVISDI